MSRRIALLPDPAGLFGLVAFLALAGSSGAKALRDGDTLWHIKFGELMLESGELITRDTFSHTAYGQPWLAHEWLSEIIMALCYRFAGLPGVALMYFAVAALTFALLFQTARHMTSDGPSLAALAIALPFAMTHLLARPHLFTWLGAALTLFLLERSGRGIWWLIPLTMIWANLHGGVLLGLAIQTLFLGGDLLASWPGSTLDGWRTWMREQRRGLIVLTASFFAATCNPFGLHLFLFPLLVSNKVFSAEIGEWQSPDFRAIWYLRFWLVAVFLAAACRGHLIAWRWRLLAVFLVWQALAHIRHVSLAVMLLTPCAAIVVHDLVQIIPWPRRKPDGSSSQLALSPWTGPAMIVVCCIALQFTFSRTPSPLPNLTEKLFPLPDSYSQGAINYLESHGAPGTHLFNHYSWGDYLIYGMKSPSAVFIDGRADMYGEQIFSDYVTMARLKPQSEELMAKYRIDWIIFPYDHPFTRTYRLDPRWRSVYTDEQAAILAKRPEILP